ncbi:MAG: sulfurtransferase-like selenium metabolism protein YedF [bacterium]|nr:sulfurtransferase-like selenium metabolism protein YedF [bacterium]
MKSIDCRNLACPGPVIQVKKTLEETPPGVSFSVDVSSESSRDNVRRFAESRGAGVRIEEGDGGAIRLVITVPVPTDPGTPLDRLRAGNQIQDAVRKPPVIFITGETLGQGDEKLGRILMEGFINTLLDQDRIPDRILFMNAGVKFAVQGSAVLKALGKMIDRGCEIFVCGTCLEFFSLSDKVSVGTVSNMFDIQGALLEAASVIRP